MIKVHYSKEDGSIIEFYDSRVHKEIPEPNLVISESERVDLYSNRLNRKIDLKTKKIKVIALTTEQEKDNFQNNVNKTLLDINKSLNKYNDISNRGDYAKLAKNGDLDLLDIFKLEAELLGYDSVDELLNKYIKRTNDLFKQRMLIRSFKIRIAKLFKSIDDFDDLKLQVNKELDTIQEYLNDIN